MNGKLYPAIALGMMLIVLTGCQSTVTKNYFSISEALNSPQARGIINPNIKLDFVEGSGTVIHPQLVSNESANSFIKSDAEACNWAFLSTVKTFQERAVEEGGAKVIHLISYSNQVPFKSEIMFECNIGKFSANVALQGDIAK